MLAAHCPGAPGLFTFVTLHFAAGDSPEAGSGPGAVTDGQGYAASPPGCLPPVALTGQSHEVIAMSVTGQLGMAATGARLS